MAKASKYKDAKFEKSLQLIRPALEWAEKQDVERLSQYLLESANIPLYCFSSGGSSASNDYLALLYESNKGMAKSLTPLAMASISDEALKTAKIVITSGGGHGCDEEYTVNRAAEVNPQGVCGITSKNDGKNVIINTLKGITNNWFLFNTPRMEGFLGTDSIIAMFGIFYKAFTKDDKFVSKLDFDLTPTHCYSYAPRVEGDIPSIKDIKNYIVLFSGWSRPIAQDFESKMIESGIASVQLCDYRNFCHGRFIFISKHLEDSAFVLFLTPREKEYAKRLILEGKTFRGNLDVFPKNTAIIKIETELDSPLASIDLMIKSQVCFNDIAKANRFSDDDDPCDPANPCGIDKRFPRSLDWGNMSNLKGLNSNIQGSKGTLKGVNRRININYDPSLTIQQNAENNKVKIPTIWKYIREKNIDRLRDERMNTYNTVWDAYIKDSDISIAKLARNLKLSENTVKFYLTHTPNDLQPKGNKIGLVVENAKVKELRESIPELKGRFEKFQKVFAKNPTLTADELLKKLNWSANVSDNVKMVKAFMQMKEFKYVFKKGKIEWITAKKPRKTAIAVEAKSTDTQDKPQDAIQKPLKPSKSKFKITVTKEAKPSQKVWKSVDGNVKGIIGAVIGEVIGSRFEFSNPPTRKVDRFTTASTFTDDTVLTMAVADAILHGRDFGEAIFDWARRYPNAGFGRRFLKLLKGEEGVSTDSFGNGGGMRVSPIGFHAKTLEEALELAKQSAIPTHNSVEGIKGAQSIATATFLALQQRPKEEIKAYIEKEFGYNLDRTDEEIAEFVSKLSHGDSKKGIPSEREFAQNTCPLAIIAFLTTDDYESSIWKSISYGCDTDTVACMCGGIAAAYYGVPQDIINEVTNYLPHEMLNIINEFDHTNLQNSRITPKTYDRWGATLVYGSGIDEIVNEKGKIVDEGGYEARQYFGAMSNVREGVCERSYAIPTMGKSLEEIKEGVDRFIKYAEDHQEETFMVIEIGCKKAGFTPKQIAPMFERAKPLPNVYLPKVFIEVPETWEQKTRKKKAKED